MALNLQTQDLPNRVFDAIALHISDEAKFSTEDPTYKKNSPEALELKRRHLTGILEGYKKNMRPNWREKYGLNYVRHELRKIRLQQHPTILRTVLYAQPLRWIVNMLLHRQQHYNAYNNALKDYGRNIAIDLNAANLQQTLNEYGFVNQLEAQLKGRMAYGPAEFSFRTAELKNSDTNYLLHFKKYPGSDTYYFEGYDASRRNTSPADNDQGMSPTLSFQTSNKMHIMATEARNLVHGNPVQKNIKGQVNWFFIHRDGSFVDTLPFNLEQQLAPLPINEMGIVDSRKAVLSDLSAGKEAFITLQLPQGQEIGLIAKVAYDPQRRCLNLEFRDEHGKVDAFDLVKDRSAAREILQNINLNPLMSRNLRSGITI